MDRRLCPHDGPGDRPLGVPGGLARRVPVTCEVPIRATVAVGGVGQSLRVRLDSLRVIARLADDSVQPLARPQRQVP
ncbi:hypothetical protein BRD17_07795 [Halobacteriales archaeon SW_7_68_16]|nr:MAG: hypothetical protein BRD17_07795 [Halobacteriales archaeon SW_7_68_16]